MNYIKSSYIIFVSKCLDIPIKYFLQKELTNFGLAVLGQNVLKMKQEKLIKIFGIYLVFRHHFFVSKWLNIITRRIHQFWIGGIQTYWVQKNYKRIFELYQVLKCLDILELYIAFKKNHVLSYYLLPTRTKSITL